MEGFSPLSITQSTIYGNVEGKPVAIAPGGTQTPLAADTARPWGVAGDRAIVVHASVLYALAKK